MKLPDYNIRNVLWADEMVAVFRFMADVHHDPAWRDRIDLARIALETGMRVSEMLKIYLEPTAGKSYLIITDNEVWIDLKKTKNHEDGRVIPVNPRLAPFLKARVARLQAKGFKILFPNPKDKPYTRWTFGRWWQKILRSAGLPWERIRHLSIHKARHSYASWALASGELDFSLIRSILGHVNRKDTDRYAHSFVLTAYKANKTPAWWAEAVRPLQKERLRVIV